MEEIVFNGEHLLPGNIGRFLVTLALVTSILGAFSYFMSTRAGDEDRFWKRLARGTFGIHLLSVLGIVATLFFIIHHHYYEYYYAWQHSSDALPVYYMISCFWEGQEGSFILWMFWHVVIGALLIFRIKKWESPVMTIIMMAQIVLTSMILGIDVGGFYLGSSPFQLLRIAKPEILTLPVMEMRGISPADYLQIVKDGTGLNPLLQNYWMVIHPPTLFFGFASSIVPFAFAVSGLWLKKYREWIKAALPWTLVSVMILGVGIIMGGIWAYESLSFGGYWAWDPVENASLIPWLLIIAGLHVMILNKNSGNSLILAYLLVIASFVLVLYSTFLNRSGILGDTSVHSFTDLGLSAQLLVFLCYFMVVPVITSFRSSAGRWLFAGISLLVLVINLSKGEFLTVFNSVFLLISLVIFIINLTKVLPGSDQEESVYSREFWMYIGSIVLMLSSLQILGGTSIPVFNKIGMALFGGLSGSGNGFISKLASGSFAPPEDPVQYYNKFQIWFAVIVAILTGFAQFFRYRNTGSLKVVGQIRRSFIITIILFFVQLFVYQLDPKKDWQLLVLLFAGSYAIAGNLLYILEGLKGKLRLAGASVAHIGFGMMLIGILVSSGKKDVISLNNKYAYSEFDEQAQRENILLYKDAPDTMGQYLVTYKGHKFEAPTHYYQVDYKDLNNGKTFTLYPNAQINPEQGLLPNPDTRHYLTHDVFTHVSSVPNDQEGEHWEDPVEHQMRLGDTIAVNRHMVVFMGVDTIDGSTISDDLSGHILQIANIMVTNLDSTWYAKPVYGVKDMLRSYQITSEVRSARIRFDFEPTGPTGYTIITSIKPREYIIMKAIVFPFINLLWAGTVVMVIGFVLSIRQRLKEKNVSSEKG